MHRLWRFFSCPLGGTLAVACVLAGLATHPTEGRAGWVASHESSAPRTVTAVPAPGPVLRTVQLPAPPTNVLVDERTRRVFVLMVSGAAPRLAVLDATTGRLLRTVSLGPPLYLGGLAVDPQSG